MNHIIKWYHPDEIKADLQPGQLIMVETEDSYYGGLLWKLDQENKHLELECGKQNYLIHFDCLIRITIIPKSPE